MGRVENGRARGTESGEVGTGGLHIDVDGEAGDAGVDAPQAADRTIAVIGRRSAGRDEAAGSALKGQNQLRADRVAGAGDRVEDGRRGGIGDGIGGRGGAAEDRCARSRGRCAGHRVAVDDRVVLDAEVEEADGAGAQAAAGQGHAGAEVADRRHKAVVPVIGVISPSLPRSFRSDLGARLRRPRPRRSRARSTRPSVFTWSRPLSAWVRRIGTRPRAVRSSVSPAASAASTSPERRSSRSPTRPATSSTRWSPNRASR